MGDIFKYSKREVRFCSERDDIWAAFVLSNDELYLEIHKEDEDACPTAHFDFQNDKHARDFFEACLMQLKDTEELDKLLDINNAQSHNSP